MYCRRFGEPCYHNLRLEDPSICHQPEKLSASTQELSELIYKQNVEVLIGTSQVVTFCRFPPLITTLGSLNPFYQYLSLCLSHTSPLI
jgi:hypothetical protein